MLSQPCLTDDQVAFFRKNGYVLLKKGFDKSDAKVINKWTLELASLPEKNGHHWVYHEKSLIDPGFDLINRVERISPFIACFNELSTKLLPSVSQLFGEGAVLFKDKINFKMSGGNGFSPHQDSQAGWEKYANYFITVMVSIDESTLENGCLQLASRDHTTLAGKEWEPLTDEQTAAMQFIPLETGPGDVIYFDSYAPHKSEANFSNKMRRLYFATYNKLSDGNHLEVYYSDKRKSYPPDIEREKGKQYKYRV